MWRRPSLILLLLLTFASGCGFPGMKGSGMDWLEVTRNAQWSARDSCGEFVYRDRMWLLGGWITSFEDPPRDVWSSADGVTWDCATAEAPWRHADLPTTLVFDDRMWFMAGWHGGRLAGATASNEVWSSTDGKSWHAATRSAAWSPRVGAAGVVFKGKMWVLGGTEHYFESDERHLKNDVWYSEDGVRWTQATPHAGWSPRAFHSAVVFNDKIYVLGGGNYVPQYAGTNDVWCSSDGVHWEQVTGAAPWSPRIWFSVVVYRDHLWLLGGWSNDPSRNWNDVWYSRDGHAWTQFKTPTIWSERHEHSAYVFRDKIWLVAGNPWPCVNDVWSLALPEDWGSTPR
jgi:hypothetical protein